jgi:hypothetical protein
MYNNVNIFYFFFMTMYLLLFIKILLIIYIHIMLFILWLILFIFTCVFFTNQDFISHTLNVMHFEKNLIKHVMNIMFGKDDTMLMWKDMKKMNIWNALWPISNNKEREFKLLATSYILNLEEKRTFKQIIKGLKTLTRYSNNVMKWIHMETSKLKGLKAHDYHVFMQQILPLCTHTLMSRSLQLLVLCMT